MAKLRKEIRFSQVRSQVEAHAGEVRRKTEQRDFCKNKHLMASSRNLNIFKSFVNMVILVFFFESSRL